ncbi:helix-turn-helix domain-containing protein [Streptomyces litchfieldiae]|uniref:Helix-turn-helix transcriptional regulator n=1 Tax=Streptomyces litchfieldiae TaxID=3075543 RepID=A0ABU2MWJ9_9ACTN|nr:helix-turn-helix transcriptional regulator [Streptomyces sp. DSM 44938]MDT0346026.1 helix-turn-helix transcriptional regulator [Streptomyces sp. DSM 44938]
MSEHTTGSTVPRRQLGRYLRDLRMKAGMTVRGAAKALEWSEPKLWRIETGQVALRALDVRAMCETYGADVEWTEALMGLARETKARGWWHAYGDVIPDGFDLFVGLEEAASAMTWYESDIVPGLLQTEQYAREIVRAHAPDVSDHEMERRVRVRTRRQAILRRPIAPPAVRFVLSDAVLRRPIGGPAVMARQLAHIIFEAEIPNLALRVVPFAAGAHAGIITGPFIVLRFPEDGNGTASEPPTVYADGFTGGLYLDKPSEVDQYDAAFQRMWDAALDEQASLRLIAEVARSYEQQH